MLMRIVNSLLIVGTILIGLTSCAGGGGSTLSDGEVFSEAMAIYLTSAIYILFDDENTNDQTSSFSGTVSEGETGGTGSIDYSNSYSAPNATFITTYNSFSPDPSQFISTLSGTLTTVTDTTDSSSVTTGTLSYSGDPLVFNIANDGGENNTGSITFRGKSYPYN